MCVRPSFCLLSIVSICLLKSNLHIPLSLSSLSSVFLAKFVGLMDYESIFLFSWLLPKNAQLEPFYENFIKTKMEVNQFKPKERPIRLQCQPLVQILLFSFLGPFIQHGSLLTQGLGPGLDNCVWYWDLDQGSWSSV